MTQFGPAGAFPPPPPVGAGYPYSQANRPWSAAAITAFVCSLLGCLAVPAVLGLVLGVVGIVRSSGGRRKGMGFAIAAIPISLITGILSIGVVAGVLLVRVSAPLVSEFVEVLKSGSGDVSAAATTLHGLGSPRFQSTVTVKDVEAWLSAVFVKHGSLTDLTGTTSDRTSRPAVAQGGLPIPILLNAKFVNGPAFVRVILVMESYTKVSIDEIDIEGSTLGGTSGESSKPDAPPLQNPP